MQNTPFNRRNNEFAGDMAAYLRQNAGDNSERLDRLKRNLRLARRDELTLRQEQMLHMHFDLEMSVTEIAQRLGVCKSTVSRTIARAKQRLQRYLRYGL